VPLPLKVDPCSFVAFSSVRFLRSRAWCGAGGGGGSAARPAAGRPAGAVADLFRGQLRVGLDFQRLGFGEPFSPVANRLDLDESRLLANLRAVRQQNRLAEDVALEYLSEPVGAGGTTGAGQVVGFPNLQPGPPDDPLELAAEAQ